jgi:hypothetical protein
MNTPIKGMKRLFLLALVATLMLTGHAGMSESDFTVQVTGTPGQTFSDNYMTVTAKGSSTSKSVSGTVPASHYVKGTIVSSVFQKQSESGHLKVEICEGGEVISESETTVAYGIVSAASQ